MQIAYLSLSKTFRLAVLGKKYSCPEGRVPMRKAMRNIIQAISCPKGTESIKIQPQ